MVRVEDFINRTVTALRVRWKSLTKKIFVRYSLLSSLIFGFSIYAYLVCNNLHNYDDLLCTPAGVGQGITAGRWLIQLIWEKQIKWGGE